jgi:ribosomal protein S4
MTNEELQSRFEHTDKTNLSLDEFLALDVLGLVHMLGLRKTKADARRLIEQGGVSINGKTVNHN